MWQPIRLNPTSYLEKQLNPEHEANTLTCVQVVRCFPFKPMTHEVLILSYLVSLVFTLVLTVVNCILNCGALFQQCRARE